jgi:hypothetical protein
MGKGKRSVSENGGKNLKISERTSMLTIALFGTTLQKQALTQHELRDKFWKTHNSKFEV